MEKPMAFPTAGAELKYLLVVSDYVRSLSFYRNVLGATLVRQISDVLCLLSLGGSEIMVVSPRLKGRTPPARERELHQLGRGPGLPGCDAAHQAGYW